MIETDPSRLSPELEARIEAVEAAASTDRGFLPGDWLALTITAVAIPILLLWIGWSG